MKIFYSGNGGGHAEPDDFLKERAYVMLSFWEITHQKREENRFADMRVERVKSKRKGKRHARSKP